MSGKVSFSFFIHRGKSDFVNVMYRVRYLGERKSGSTGVTIKRSSWDSKSKIVSASSLADKKVRSKLLDLRDYVVFELKDSIVEQEGFQPSALMFFDAIEKKLSIKNSQEKTNIPLLTDLIHDLLSLKKRSKNTEKVIRYSIKSVEEYEGLIGKKLSAFDFDYDHAFAICKNEVEKRSLETAKIRITYVINAINEAKKIINRKKVEKRSLVDSKILEIPDVRKADLLRGYRVPDRAEKERVYLSVEETIELYEAAKQLPNRYRFYINLYVALYFTGMRVSEILDRKYSDIVTRTASVDGELKQVKGILNESQKGKKQDLFTPCSEILLEIISERPSKVLDPTKEPLIYNFSGKSSFTNQSLKRSLDRLNNMNKSLGLDERIKVVKYPDGSERVETYEKKYNLLTWHTARHGFGAFMLQSGMPIEVVSEILGHSSISITEGWYKHVNLTKSVHQSNSFFNSAINDFYQKRREDTTPPKMQTAV
ncbi:tyrosine-type recombinase/integrase [Roseivirga spongicola]|uniref:tyrosine-type recombinase/integrase n=1 Tax=Roseivirga spongicola TaxID=333140 RepID=UPI002AC9DD50|nr:site-specific integrase [Roseivirga spongicola]WPZ08712.1 site-specific integrase [Roseivirga spongicola]